MSVRTDVVLPVGTVLAVVATMTLLTFTSSSTALAASIGCGGVLTRSVVLSHDLLNCTGNGLVIGAGGSTVDLGGHTVDGTLSDHSVGVKNVGHANVIVKHGAVREFDRGVQLLGAAGNQLRGLMVSQNSSDGIDLNHAAPTRSSAVRSARTSPASGWRTAPAGTWWPMDRPGQRRRRHPAAGATNNRVTANIVNSNGSSAHPFTGQILLVGANRNRNRNDANDASVSSTIAIVLLRSDHHQIVGNLAGSVGSDGNAGGIFPAG